jgi:hypothetical protein
VGTAVDVLFCLVSISTADSTCSEVWSLYRFNGTVTYVVVHHHDCSLRFAKERLDEHGILVLYPAPPSCWIADDAVQANPVFGTRE